jgi:uncharacterized membrane protein
MKKIIIIAILALLAVSAFFIFRPKNPEETAAPEPAAEIKPEKIVPDQSQATAKNYRESSEKYKYQIDVSYPVFSTLADKKILDAINSQIEQDVQKEIDSYIAEARRNKIAPTFGYLTGKYEYSVEGGKTISVRLDLEKILSGSTSPQNISVTLNYDLESGKKITSVP